MSIVYVDYVNGIDGTIASQPLWVLATSYKVNDKVRHVENSVNVIYTCTTAHAATTLNEPGVAPSWTAYWALNPIQVACDGTAALPYRTPSNAATLMTADGSDEIRIAKGPENTLINATFAFVDGSTSASANANLNGIVAQYDVIGNDTIGWWTVSSISYGATTNITLYKAFSGSPNLQSTDIYKLGVVMGPVAAGSSTQVWQITRSGTAAETPLKISGGWDLAAEISSPTPYGQTTNQTGRTAFNHSGISYWGYLFYCSGTYVHFDNFWIFRYNYGVTCTTANGLCRATNMVFGATQSNSLQGAGYLLIDNIKIYGSSGGLSVSGITLGGVISNVSVYSTTGLAFTINTCYGVQISNVAVYRSTTPQLTTSNSCVIDTYRNEYGTQGIYIQGSHNNVVKNATFIGLSSTAIYITNYNVGNVFQGVTLTNCLNICQDDGHGNRLSNITSTGTSGSWLYSKSNAGDLYLDNVEHSEALTINAAGWRAGAHSRIVIRKFGGSDTDHRSYSYHGQCLSVTGGSARSGLAWQVTPNSYAKSYYPYITPVGEVFVRAGATVSIKLYVKKSGANPMSGDFYLGTQGSAGLIIETAADLHLSDIADTNWTLLTVTAAATEDRLMQFYLQCWGSDVITFDDFSAVVV